MPAKKKTTQSRSKTKTKSSTKLKSSPKNDNLKPVIALIALFALIGGFFVFRSYASQASNLVVNANNFKGGVPVYKTTSKGNEYMASRNLEEAPITFDVETSSYYPSYTCVLFNNISDANQEVLFTLNDKGSIAELKPGKQWVQLGARSVSFFPEIEQTTLRLELEVYGVDGGGNEMVQVDQALISKSGQCGIANNESGNYIIDHAKDMTGGIAYSEAVGVEGREAENSFVASRYFGADDPSVSEVTITSEVAVEPDANYTVCVLARNPQYADPSVSLLPHSYYSPYLGDPNRKGGVPEFTVNSRELKWVNTGFEIPLLDDYSKSNSSEEEFTLTTKLKASDSKTGKLVSSNLEVRMVSYSKDGTCPE